MYSQPTIHQDGFSDLLNTYALPTCLAQGYAENLQNQNQNYNSPDHSNASSVKPEKTEIHLFQCRYCNRFFHQNQTLKQHILTHTGQRPFECKICFKSFTQQGSLQRHISTHTGAKPFECTFCHLGFSQKNNLQRHMKIHTGAPKEFQCQTCHRSFDRKRTLEIHEATHLPKQDRPKVNCTCCNRQFKTKEILQKHLRRQELKLKGNENSEWLKQNNTGNRKQKHTIINCRHCGKTFRRSTSVLSITTGIIATSCLKCSSYTGTNVPWGIHKEVELLECDICKAQFINKDLFEKHKETHREDYKHECDVCHFRFKLKGLLKRHKASQHDAGNNQCHICGLNFKYVSKLKAHYYLCHTEELKDDLDEYVTLFTCADCDRIFYMRSQITQHVRRHLKNPVTRKRGKTDTPDQKSNRDTQHFLEPYINLASADRPKYNQIDSDNDVHLDPMEDDYFLGAELEVDKPPPKDQPFFCYVCKKTYGSKATLNQHFQTEHEEHDDFECEYCAKSFRSRNSLYKHKQTHRPDAYGCEQCGKTFSRKFSLTSHILTHSEKNVKCPCCTKKFYMKAQLRTHMKKHRGEKNYECGVCEKRFYDLTRLNRHHLTHSGERNFQCHICHLSFTQKNHLDKHFLRHDEIEKKVTFHCGDCEKVFYRKDNYLRHCESHDVNRTHYPCPLCDKKFKDKYIMKKHLASRKCVDRKIKCEVETDNEEDAKKGSKRARNTQGGVNKQIYNRTKVAKKKAAVVKRETERTKWETVDKKIKGSNKKLSTDKCKDAKKKAKKSKRSYAKKIVKKAVSDKISETDQEDVRFNMALKKEDSNYPEFVWYT